MSIETRPLSRRAKAVLMIFVPVAVFMLALRYGDWLGLAAIFIFAPAMLVSIGVGLVLLLRKPKTD